MVKSVFAGKAVSIVGVGGAGSNIAERLLRLGCNLRIIDRDRVYDHEFARQALYTKAVWKKFKAKEAKKVLDSINPDVEVKSFHEDLVADNSFLLKGNLVIDASNDPKTNLVVQEANAQNKIPVIQINYAADKAIISFYTNKKPVVKFTKTIQKNGISEELVDLITGAVVHQAKTLFSKGKPKPSIDIDAKLLKIA